MQVPDRAIRNLIGNIKKLDNPKESAELLRRWDEDREKYKDSLDEDGKVGGIKVGVDIKDTDLFKNYLGMMKDMLTDDRIDKRVREEYYHRYLKEVEGEGGL